MTRTELEQIRAIVREELQAMTEKKPPRILEIQQKAKNDFEKMLRRGK